MSDPLKSKHDSLEADANSNTRLKVMNRPERIGVGPIKEAGASVIDDGVIGFDSNCEAASRIVFKTSPQFGDRVCADIQARLKVAAGEMNDPAPAIDKDSGAVKPVMETNTE